jgi:hypothetical protein
LPSYSRSEVLAAGLRDRLQIVGVASCPGHINNQLGVGVADYPDFLEAIRK